MSDAMQYKQTTLRNILGSLLVLACTQGATCKSEALTTTRAFLPRSLSGGSHHAPALPVTSASFHSTSSHGEWDTAVNEIHANRDQLIDAEFVAETNLPTDLGHFRLRAYRVARTANEFMGTEPTVIYCTDKPPFGKAGKLAENVPVRVHDQCLTSEVFRSQRCDCNDQLKMALGYIQKHGGFIIYLQQEGRGIGLANKVAAYALQDVGMDTVDANIHLGFPEDCRQYGVVPSILKDMQISSIQLLTNNPRKVDRLGALGVKVSRTLPMVIKRANPYNRRYLETKQRRMNHTNFGAMLLASDMELNEIPDIELNELLTPPKHSIADEYINKHSIADDYINEGEEMAANAVQLSLNTLLQEDSLSSPSPLGVTVAEDGYCFGRKSVEDAIAAVKRGEMVVVVDDMNRENEGDLIIAADMCTPRAMGQIVRYSSGVVCVAMEGDRMDELKLPPMVTNNEDPKGTAFSVSVDATKAHGITTGISATDRSKTIQLLADPSTTASDFARPGHIFPLRAREGGVLARDGHTEAAVDLSRLAGLNPCGVLCEIVSEEDPTGMARLPELKTFARKHKMVLTSIVDIAQYRRDTEQ